MRPLILVLASGDRDATAFNSSLADHSQTLTSRGDVCKTTEVEKSVFGETRDNRNSGGKLPLSGYLAVAKRFLRSISRYTFETAPREFSNGSDDNLGLFLIPSSLIRVIYPPGLTVASPRPPSAILKASVPLLVNHIGGLAVSGSLNSYTGRALGNSIVDFHVKMKLDEMLCDSEKDSSLLPDGSSDLLSFGDAAEDTWRYEGSCGDDNVGEIVGSLKRYTDSTGMYNLYVLCIQCI